MVVPLEPTLLSRYAAAELIEQAAEWPRFVVASVTGAYIDPANTTAHGSRSSATKLPTSYYVQDRAYCYRVVAAFEAEHDHTRKGAARSSDGERLRQAQARCDELNAKHA